MEINREISSVFEKSLSEENFFESTIKLKDGQTGIPVLVYGGLECDMKLQKLTLLPYRELGLRYDFLPEDCDLTESCIKPCRNFLGSNYDVELYRGKNCLYYLKMKNFGSSPMF